MIIEMITGNRLSEEFDRRIFNRLDMTSSYLPDSPEIKGEYTHGYAYTGQDNDEPPDPDDYYDVTEYLDPSVIWASGAIISNLEDLRVWAQALAEGELLDCSTQEERLEWIEVPGGEGILKYGLGMLYLGGLLGHNGQVPGYLCSMFYFPQEDATIVVLANATGAELSTYHQELVMRIARILFPGEVPW